MSSNSYSPGSKNTPSTSPEEAALTAGVLSPRNGSLGTNCSIPSAKSKITPTARLWLQVDIIPCRHHTCDVFIKHRKRSSQLTRSVSSSHMAHTINTPSTFAHAGNRQRAADTHAYMDHKPAKQQMSIKLPTTDAKSQDCTAADVERLHRSRSQQCNYVRSLHTACYPGETNMHSSRDHKSAQQEPKVCKAASTKSLYSSRHYKCYKTATSARATSLHSSRPQKSQQLEP